MVLLVLGTEDGDEMLLYDYKKMLQATSDKYADEVPHVGVDFFV